MIDRIPSGFDPFVIPFVAGMVWVLGYCLVAAVRIFFQLCGAERRRFLLSLVTPRTMVKNVWDIFANCLLHVKLWQRNRLLGYMHSSIAFGWFMLILLGHIEVFLFVPERVRFFYYPIFFNFFVAEADATVKGAVLFFLMDVFLLIILSGIVLAIVKRVRSRFFGMRRTTRHSLPDRIAMYSLWAIFPLRLLAETFTAHISGGSFLTEPTNSLLVRFFGNDLNYMPTWWAYSTVLGLFMFVLPFTRYLHIPAEMMLIPMRNAGLKLGSARRGLAKVQVYSCPGCGVCIDACPMSVSKGNLKYCTVYLNRAIRRRQWRKVDEISDKCLLCGKCEALCQVGAEGPQLRIMQRSTRKYAITPDFRAMDTSAVAPAHAEGKVLYFSGCMSALTPAIPRSVCSLLDKAGVRYEWMDRDGGLCCGRPMHTAGRLEEAAALRSRMQELISGSGASVLLVSCPICYRTFAQDYELPGVEVVHYSVYFQRLVQAGRLRLRKSEICYVYHDPCELGRGCGIYEQPRKLLGQSALLVEAPKTQLESICCGGSLGSLSFDFRQRERMTRAALDNLCSTPADAIATACPLCKATFARYADRPVRDLAEILDAQASPQEEALRQL